jgi:hypothetical protein
MIFWHIFLVNAKRNNNRRGGYVVSGLYGINTFRFLLAVLVPDEMLRLSSASVIGHFKSGESKLMCGRV